MIRTSQLKARDFLSNLKIPNNICVVVKFCFPNTGSPQAFGSLARNKVMFNIVVYITVLTEVCLKFVHFVEISISGEISMIYFELEIL